VGDWTSSRSFQVSRGTRGLNQRGGGRGARGLADEGRFRTSNMSQLRTTIALKIGLNIDIDPFLA
jgi:hypothetical protein